MGLSPSYVLIQRNHDDAFVRYWESFLRLWNNRCGGGHRWRRRWRRWWWWRRRGFELGLGLGLGFRRRLDKRDVRRGEKTAAGPILAGPLPQVRIFLHDLYDNFAFDEREFVVFCSLQAMASADRKEITVRMAMSYAPHSRTARLQLSLGLQPEPELPPEARVRARAQLPARARSAAQTASPPMCQINDIQTQSERVPEQRVPVEEEEAAAAEAGPQTPVLVQLRALVRQVEEEAAEEGEGEEAAQSRSTLIQQLILAEGTYRKFFLGLRVPSSTGSTYYCGSANCSASHSCGCTPSTRGGHGRDNSRDSRSRSRAASRLFFLGTLLCQRLTLAPR
jgi:hypothetical protein